MDDTTKPKDAAVEPKKDTAPKDPPKPAPKAVEPKVEVTEPQAPVEPEKPKVVEPVVEEKPAPEPPKEPEPPKPPVVPELFMMENDLFKAWVVSAGDKYMGNLEVKRPDGSSVYTYPADTAEDAEDTLLWNIRNLKL
ncbi:MAG: hypothetical protein JSS66_05835 [Armatimonadetes bacterium]|nr:hypothetical protein [Armatimonadota bacterium]